MKAIIDFTNKEIHFDEHTSMEDLAYFMINNFPTEIWGDFKFMIDAGTNESPNLEWDLHFPF